MISVSDLPAVNATLNAASALLMATGYYFIRRGDRKTHQRFMLAAFSASTLFLISYLTYHFQVGSVRFRGTGALRLVYFSVLLTHTVLAAVILPLVLITLSRALNERFDQHRRIARWTLPLWFYVSATGVLVYWMLYRL
jgi:putative membrane protein